MNPVVIAEDAVKRLHEAAELCDRARAEAEASDEQLALSLEQAASVIESISPVAIPAGTSARRLASSETVFRSSRASDSLTHHSRSR